jgi:hypothetical protein
MRISEERKPPLSNPERPHDHLHTRKRYASALQVWILLIFVLVIIGIDIVANVAHGPIIRLRYASRGGWQDHQEIAELGPVMNLEDVVVCDKSIGDSDSLPLSQIAMQRGSEKSVSV